MGNFCTTPENDEQPNTQWNPNECIDSHYSQKPLKRLEKSETIYKDLELISSTHHRIERCRKFEKYVVLKRIEKNIFLRKEQLEIEKQILLNVRFPFICKLIQYKDQQASCVFELENCLYDIQNHQINEEQLLFMVASIVLAIQEIHKAGYVYRALHQSHILIGEDGYIRLIGFGHSSNTSSCPNIVSYDELRIFPPETVHGKFDQCGDWWSLGALIYKIFYGHYPFENEQKNFELMKYDKLHNEVNVTEIGDVYSLMCQLLSLDCKKRAQQIFEKEIIDISFYYYQLIMNENQVNYPNFEEQQPQQIDEPTVSQAMPMNEQVYDNKSRPLGQASGEERKQFMIESLRALAVQQILQLILTLGYSFKDEWGFCSSILLFISFTITLHLYLAVHKTRGFQKEGKVMKLQWLVWSISYSFMMTLFSTLLSIEYFGWYYYLPYFVTSFFFPTLTIIVIIELKTGNTVMSIKQYNILFFIIIFFLDLIISLFDDGFIHFGYLIGELISYLYGLYLTHINIQIQFPVSDLSLNIEQEQTKFDQALNIVNKGIEQFEIGTINTEKEITIEELKNQHGMKRLLKLGFFLCFGLIFQIFPWMYIILGILLMIITFKADTKFVQFGKKQEVCLDEQFIAPILINLDILGGLKHFIE